MKCRATVRLGLAVVGLCAVAGLLPAPAQGDTFYSWFDSTGASTADPKMVLRYGDGFVAIEGEYALKADGTVWKSARTRIDRMPGLSDIVQITSGSIVRKRDGTVWTWGDGQYNIAQMPGLSNVVAISAALSGPNIKALALKSNGTVWAWGQGPVGDGSTTNCSTPVQVVPGLTNVTHISAGGVARYALTSGGTVWAWGQGPLGDGSAYLQTVPSPVQVPGLSNVGVRAICGADIGGWAILTNGTALGWGYNSKGEVGSGDSAQHLTPVPVKGSGTTPLQGVRDIAYMIPGNGALKADGTVAVWGGGLFGYNGFSPALLSSITGISRFGFLRREAVPVEVGAQTVAVPEGGTATMSVRLGAAPTGVTTVNLMRVSGDLDLTVAAGASLTFTPANWDGWQSVTLAAAEDADTSCGTADFSAGVLGYPADTLVRVTEIDNDATSGNTLWTWGANDYGQLGDGTQTPRVLPVRVFRNVVSVAGGATHSLAIDGTGNVWAWGRNKYGQLGVNRNSDMELWPVQAVISNVTVDAGDYEWGYPTVALKADGTVWSPGMTQFFQQSGVSDVIGVALGSYHRVALKRNGTVWTWGSNYRLSLGLTNDLSYNAYFPTQIPGLAGIVAVSAGPCHTVAIKSDGTLVGWGENGSGQLGDGTFTDRPTPVAVAAGLSNVTAIAAGGIWSADVLVSHTLALKADGSVWAWGENSDGQLGDGTTINSATPVRVVGLSNVTAIAANGCHSVARTSDGRAWTWGWNGYGQLGDGTLTSRSTPAPVSGVSGVVAISAGERHTLAVGAEGAASAVAADDAYSTPQDTALIVAAPGVLANDTGTGLTAVMVSDPAHGTAVLVPDGRFIYMPQPGYSGADSFAYKACMGALESNVGVVRLTVVANNNHPPTITTAAAATSNPVTLPAGITVSVAASDPDNDALTYSWTQVTGPGAATFSAPTAASSGVTFSGAGEYQLQVMVSDGRGGSASSSVLVRVNLNFDIRADVNHDGAVNALDSQIIIKNFGSVTK